MLFFFVHLFFLSIFFPPFMFLFIHFFEFSICGQPPPLITTMTTHILYPSHNPHNNLGTEYLFFLFFLFIYVFFSGVTITTKAKWHVQCIILGQSMFFVCLFTDIWHVFFRYCFFNKHKGLKQCLQCIFSGQSMLFFFFSVCLLTFEVFSLGINFDIYNKTVRLILPCKAMSHKTKFYIVESNYYY